VDHGAKVINLSLGGEGWSQTLQDATDYAFSHGALVVAAAGNCGDPVNYSCLNYNPVIYPAANPNVLAVGATTSSDTRAPFSEYGYFVDVTAPGENIYSTLWDDTYQYLSGTSMASPLVAGLASLVWARNSTLSNAQVAAAIQSTAVDLGTPGRDDEYGYGRVNAAAAVSAVGSLGISSSSVPELGPSAKVHAPANAPLRPGVVLVRWKPGALAADRQSVLARQGVGVAGQIEAIGVQKLIVPAGRESETAAQLAADPAVEFAEPDYQVHLIR
jgi:subtilisin family serine protease